MTTTITIREGIPYTGKSVEISVEIMEHDLTPNAVADVVARLRTRLSHAVEEELRIAGIKLGRDGLRIDEA